MEEYNRVVDPYHVSNSFHPKSAHCGVSSMPYTNMCVLRVCQIVYNCININVNIVPHTFPYYHRGRIKSRHNVPNVLGKINGDTGYDILYINLVPFYENRWCRY